MLRQAAPRAIALAGSLLLLALPAVLPSAAAEVRVPVPVLMGVEGLQAPVALEGVAGALGLKVEPGVVRFGPAGPGEWTAPVRLEVANLGAVALRVSVLAGPLVEPGSGAAIAPSRIEVAQEGGVAQPLASPVQALAQPLAPGERAALLLRVHVPAGGAQWVPEGEYAGALEVVGVPL